MGKIYNISLRENFLETISEFIVKNIEAKNIAEYTVVFPNNYSCQMFKKILIRQRKIIMLPNIVSIFDMLLFDEHKITMLILGILKKRNENIPLSTVFELSLSVTKLIKEFIINNISFEKLDNIIPENFGEYWKHTAEIIHECINSPEIKQIIDTGMLSLKHFIKSISDNKRKIIAVGTIYISRYIRDFLKSVYYSDSGIIFVSSDNESQNKIYNDMILSELSDFSLSALSESIPKDETDNDVIREIAEFSNVFEEARAIAIKVRKTISENKKILIVVSNIDLANKIKIELLKWNIISYDSHGVDFVKTYSGILISLILDAFSDKFSTSSVLNIFKFCKNYNEKVLKFELFLKRHSKIYKNFWDALDQIYNYKNIELNDIVDLDFQKCAEYFRDILNANGLLSENKNEIEFVKKSFLSWSNIIKELIHLLDDETAVRFEELIKKYIDYSYLFDDIYFDEYCNFLKKQCFKFSVRTTEANEGVIMLDIIDAQLLDSDFIIIAGANEDSFTSSEQENFWMSDSVMKILGIPTKEIKDYFIQCTFERFITKTHVLVTRSTKNLGVQQVKYPFLEKISQKVGLKQNTELSDYVQYCNINNTNLHKTNLPAPKPDIKNRPTKFSVTDIELLRNNAYAFYAKKILNIKELNEIDEINNLRGNYVHLVLDYFIKKRNEKNNTTNIYELSKEILKKLNLNPSKFGLWFYRINNILAFVEKNSKNDIISVSEIRGDQILKITDNYSCEIICKADRIDISDLNLNNPSITVIDYKTSSGKITKKDVENGKKIQLPVEAWIAQSNGFKIAEINESKISSKILSLQYWFLKKECEKIIVTNDYEKTNQLIEKTMNQIQELIKAYNVDCLPYYVNISDEYNENYMHLARVKEWFNAQ